MPSTYNSEYCTISNMAQQKMALLQICSCMLQMFAFCISFQYLQMLDYTKSVQTFESEASENGKQIILDALPPSQDENQMHVQVGKQ